MIELAPSSTLDAAYALNGARVVLKELEKEIEYIKRPSGSSPPLDESGNLPASTTLLLPSDGRLIASCLDVPEMEQEIERAIHQIQGELKAKKESEGKEEKEEKEEKTPSIGAANGGPKGNGQ